MAQICIYDAQGRRICYSNHTVTVERAIKYSIDFWDVGPGRNPTHVAHGALPDTATRLDKLQVLVDTVIRTTPYNATFDNWDHVLADWSDPA